MATTAPGSPYVESSDLVANYPAVSEALAERVDLVGVLPFASAAARTTALPTPTDGQYSYLQDTNATEYWDGSAWVAAGVAPGLVHISTTAFSGSGSVSLNNVFTSDYGNYRVLFYAKTSSTAAQVYVRLRAGGTDNTSSLYEIQEIAGNSTSVSGARSSSQTQWSVAFFDTDPCNLSFDLFAPQAATYTNFNAMNCYQQSGVGSRISLRVGLHRANTSYDGMTFYSTTNNFDGYLRVYGYKNS